MAILTDWEKQVSFHMKTLLFVGFHVTKAMERVQSTEEPSKELLKLGVHEQTIKTTKRIIFS
ncbi:hypothetical protein IEQ34_017405 [Dendrobium chrysotoxum]|uniref:Uncharacterized protein n=1 Tax=Dendrobium chrysotoxum TaxID=161865 RepID=A0AAV7GA31_DENCH|nr:hypothetical protein IEQ34_017405 [Dendrobium chrysotoxum]